jgi:hypothetical protein
MGCAGMNLWDKKQVTISGERIAKVDRVASQVFWCACGILEIVLVLIRVYARTNMFDRWQS